MWKGPDQMKYHGKIVGVTFLGGPTYSEGEYPPRWHNETPLPYRHYHMIYSQTPFLTPEKREQILKKNEFDVTQLQLERFPCIDDFEVVMRAPLFESENQENDFDYTACFFSPSRGYLAGFCYYTHEDYTTAIMSQAETVIPWGTLTFPYYDFGQSYAFMVMEADGYIYVLNGTYEEAGTKGYKNWFKVEKNRYFSQWEHARQLSRAYEEQRKKQ
ncbi:hypothetical protein [Tengunoibacter tsumagoiensis]|uniref:Uncharacterized protein n=1 Tax=Tengunoibacter tsumagoiensis TaxID=2014871 RepID=A0A401ZYT5_9CHLR|nr:hypothetical protein [Tengunoibacter tsumagoiensis]GCE12016.1 hypothetical protein KTT_18750 [Tengunoibacter tsumagoiensis]